MSAITETRTETRIGLDDLEHLESQVRGNVITPNHPAYDSARLVFNRMIDKHPALVVQCMDVADVIAGVNFGRKHGLPVAIRGGGHNAAGLGTCDGGIVIDLNRMNNVQVNPNTKRVRVGGGAVTGDVDHATQPFGLAVPFGIASTTGVGGLTLGGGFGHLSRGFGLTCDNLISADLVTSDGKFITASENEHPDLFWAIRGGGGNFGVVTSFEFQAHPVGMVFGGLLGYTVEKADALLRLFRDFIPTAPREQGMFFGYMMAPPEPFIPEHLQMTPITKVISCFNGSESEGQALLEPFLELEPDVNLVSQLPFADLNCMFDAAVPPGLLDYWKADYDSEISDEMIDVHLKYGPQAPNLTSLAHHYAPSGAVQDVAQDATAYSYRDAAFNHVILSLDSDPSAMPANVEWVRNYWDALRPYSAGGAYVNFMMDEGSDRVEATYRGNYPRLQKIKNAYDPENLFRINQNINPA